MGHGSSSSFPYNKSMVRIKQGTGDGKGTVLDYESKKK